MNKITKTILGGGLTIGFILMMKYGILPVWSAFGSVLSAFITILNLIKK